MQPELSRGATQRYSAGNKVYGAGRSNPTSGTVDPSGYIDRGLNNQTSDRRSGLAQAAFNRLSSMGAAGNSGPLGKAPVGGALPTVQDENQRQAIINQNFTTTPEGHYVSTAPTLSPRPPQQSNNDFQGAIMRRLQGGLNGN
jgi:hypothetical protein